MLSLSLTTLVPWIIDHGYFIFYLISIVEGTFTTVAAGVTTGFGYYNIYLIILIAIAGDLTADIIYYIIGYKSRNMLLERYGHYLGMTKERIDKIERRVQKHFTETMLIVKLSPFIPVPGLIAIGASHVSIKKFIKMSFLITAPKSIFFALLGFYSIKTYMYLNIYINNISYIIGIVTLLSIIIYNLYRKITSYAIQKVDSI